jgi:hypothetical protein
VRRWTCSEDRARFRTITDRKGTAAGTGDDLIGWMPPPAEDCRGTRELKSTANAQVVDVQ